MPGDRGRGGGALPPHHRRRPTRHPGRLLRPPGYPRPGADRGRAAHSPGQPLGWRLTEPVHDSTPVIQAPRKGSPMSVTPPQAATHPASLFTASGRSAAAEAELEHAVAGLIEEFLGTKVVSAPVDPAALAGRFAASELPTGSMRPERYLKVLAEDVVPYDNRNTSPRSLANMNQGLPGFMRPLARLLVAMNQNVTK